MGDGHACAPEALHVLDGVHTKERLPTDDVLRQRRGNGQTITISALNVGSIPAEFFYSSPLQNISSPLSNVSTWGEMR